MMLTIGPRCQYCGGRHDTVCHRIKEIEYYKDGRTKRVEFYDNLGSAPTITISPHAAPDVFDITTGSTWVDGAPPGQWSHT